MNGTDGGGSGGVGGAVKAGWLGSGTGVKFGVPSGDEGGVGIGGIETGAVTEIVGPGDGGRNGGPAGSQALTAATTKRVATARLSTT